MEHGLHPGWFIVSRPSSRIIPRRIGYGDYSLMSAAPPPGVAVRTFCTPGMARRRVATSAAWGGGQPVVKGWARGHHDRVHHRRVFFDHFGEAGEVAHQQRLAASVEAAGC